MRQSFGEDIERIIICAGAGGGTGSGSALPLYKLARYYLQQIGAKDKVGMIVTLPKKTEGGKVQGNAYQVLSDLKLLVDSKDITPFILVDNETIHQMFPNVSAKEFWNTANKNIVGLFDIFNVLACQNSQYATFDREDYRSLLDSGTLIFGATKLTQYEKDTDISDGLRNNLKRTLLSEVDLTSASHIAAILCAPDKLLGVLPQSHIDLAFTTLERMVSGENRDVMMHQGIYEAKRLGLYLYTMVGGLKIPENRLNIMKARSGMFEL
jgi:cell division GTPase FtsZ